jgi:hypothetical protein
VIADGTLEAMKWLALVLMLLDHINKFLFQERLPGIFEAARCVMPIFGFVLACKLSRPGTTPAAYRRTMLRLLAFGVLATPMVVAMEGGWPVNILFTLLLAVAMMALLNHGGRRYTAAAVVLFVIEGFFVEYWWFGVLVCLSAWAYCRRPSRTRLLLWIGAILSLGLINGNLWALMALPIIFAAPYLSLRIPRMQYVFYAFYPAHLAVIWMIWRA